MNAPPVQVRILTPRPAGICTRVLLMLCVCVTACASRDRIDRRIEAAALAGDYGQAREAIQKHLNDDPSDKSYLLDRLRLLILTLADGQPDAAELPANDLYALLRTQGLNADKTVASVVFNERVKVWKGEPFEQALAYTYIGVQKAMRGEWDNARAAAQSSLFLLRDFGDNERGGRMTAEDLARRAVEAERAGKNPDAVIDRGYAPVGTNYTLGYLLNAVANAALGRRDEAQDNLAQARRIDPSLGPLCDVLAAGDYNTVLVVDYGRGPVKQAFGEDGALARFVPITPSTNEPLRAAVVSPGGARTTLLEGVPPGLDVNPMARDLMWNSLESVRETKSALGTLMVVGGVVVATTPQGKDESDEARRNRALIGAGVAVLGALLKASASADTRHCEFFPQRTYLVPLLIEAPMSTIELAVGSERMSLFGFDPPSASAVQMRYVRLQGTPGWGASAITSNGLIYANDRYPWRVPGDDLPYLFGGRCVRTPSAEVMAQYHEAGNLTWMTSSDLANLYREEGITFTIEEQHGKSRRHILEGGDSLVCPLPGTAGYQRLFARPHAPYEPRSKALQAAIERLRGAAAGQRTNP
ncbi:MAG: hypothetical protein HBSAPP03_24840 [Phycisphaerae bacterium]|nr:MAG: hypothetical protein HBSAPP03_24840 [Phycisphaerae bacterium]